MRPSAWHPGIWKEPTVRLVGFDHLVITVRDTPTTIEFYERVLGMHHVVFEGSFDALHFGSQKINLHIRDPDRNLIELACY
jgi:extradiol dioxygenase family protein